MLAEGGRWPVPARPVNWTWRYLLLGLVLGGVLFLLGRSGRTKSLARRLYLLLATLWALLAGIAGLVITWLALFSAHRAAHQNENLFLFNLLLLALAVALPAAVRGRRWAGNSARRLALAVAALAALGLLLKLASGVQSAERRADRTRASAEPGPLGRPQDPRTFLSPSLASL